MIAEERPAGGVELEGRESRKFTRSRGGLSNGEVICAQAQGLEMPGAAVITGLSAV